MKQQLWISDPQTCFLRLLSNGRCGSQRNTNHHRLCSSARQECSCYSHYLSHYHDKMMQLFQVVLGGTDEKSVQSHPRNITLWWLLMIVHYNTWTRAVITKQLDLFILNFEMRWSLVYQSKVNDPSWCTLKDAILNLSYCCVRWNRIGSSWEAALPDT